MAHGKDKHYWTQLRATLTAGQWTSPTPGKAPNATPLSWSELLRKFNKHCHGFTDVAEIASQTQALAILLGANAKDEDREDAGRRADSLLPLSAECQLAEERIEEATAGYEVLKGLQSSNFDSLSFALAYYAYALGRPEECLKHLANVPDISHIGSRIPQPGSVRSTTSALQVPETTRTNTTASSWAGSVESSGTSSIGEITDGSAWSMTETLRSLCLQGMTLEKLSPNEPRKALDVYARALPLISSCDSEIPALDSSPSVHVDPTSSGKLDFPNFRRFRELWRWVERIIWRAIVLASKNSTLDRSDPKDGTLVWTWFTRYMACSPNWPPSFRTQHRSTVCALHLRALVLRAKLTPTKPVSADLIKPAPWIHTARKVVDEYRAILNVSTGFPKAGDRNVRVEDLTDLCVAVWEVSGASGDHAGWVIDVMWWATRLTFNSFRVFRHMARLFRASGDTGLSKRMVRLYAQVVGKAYQTGEAGFSTDADSDEQWVETLIQGARMLCRLAGDEPGLGGLKDAREAGTFIEKAKTRLNVHDDRLTASVDLAEGIWSTVLAIKEQEPRTRPSRLAHAHQLLLRSVERFPTPSGYYHLALSLARPGPLQNLDQAIECAGGAVQDVPTEIRYWHLLGLLLSAKERWAAAKEIFEKAVDIGDVNLGIEDGANSTPGASTNGNDWVTIRDYGAPEAMNGGPGPMGTFGSGHQIGGMGSEPSESTLRCGETAGTMPTVFLVEATAKEPPPGETLLEPLDDYPAPSRRELFEHALQLRMSQVTLAEYVEGAESAADQWFEVFKWISEKRENYEPRIATSVDGRQSIEMGPPPSVVLSHAPEADESSTGTSENRQSVSSLAPPPITISPAAPDENPDDYAKATELFYPSGSLSSGGLNPPGNGTSKGKRVQRILKNRVQNISRRIGQEIVKGGGGLRRSRSTPDFDLVLHHTQYQASSIHSRRRLSSLIHKDHSEPAVSSPPPPPLPLPPPVTERNSQIAKDHKLLSDLWLMSAATFRRIGKIEQAKGAIQEAEVKDENNPAVWVQFGLYNAALGKDKEAIESFQKALFVAPDDVSASVHLCRMYLTSVEHSLTQCEVNAQSDNVDLAAGMLSHLTRGVGWDVPEAWYFLAKAYGVQGRKEKEKECLVKALELSESKGVRDIATALGCCL